MPPLTPGHKRHSGFCLGLSCCLGSLALGEGGHSSSPMERPMGHGTEAFCPQPCVWAWKRDPLGPVKTLDDCGLGGRLDCIFMRDQESEPPSKAAPEFLIHWGCWITVTLSHCFGAITRQWQLLYLLVGITPVAVPPLWRHHFLSLAYFQWCAVMLDLSRFKENSLLISHFLFPCIPKLLPTAVCSHFFWLLFSSSFLNYSIRPFSSVKALVKWESSLCYSTPNLIFCPHLTWLNYSFDKYLLSSYYVTRHCTRCWIYSSKQNRPEKKRKNNLPNLMEGTCGVGWRMG